MPYDNKPNLQDPLDPNSENGYACGKIFDPHNEVNYIKAPCEKILDADGVNSFIVFGRDRLGSMFDTGAGNGPLGMGKDSSMDIVVGRLSSVKRRIVEKTSPIKGKKQKTIVVPNANPSVSADACRIYLSQRTDIDKHFKIPITRSGQAVGQAAIALKSDNVRMIARNSMKLVVGCDTYLANGNQRMLNYGVELIGNAAGEPDNIDLQPIPKGGNLVDAFMGLTQVVKQLNDLMFGNLEIQSDILNALKDHTHLSPFFGKPTSPSPNLAVSISQAKLQLYSRINQGLLAHLNNLVAFKSKYLFATGPGYINSKYHKLN